jgi:heme-degrading monooxygenase HmoA
MRYSRSYPSPLVGGGGKEEALMSEIREANGICTQITTVKLSPENQDEILKLMVERSRFMATQPGFVSVNLHRSKDGSHVVNYVQWTNPDKLAAAHHSPEFRKKWPRFGQLVQEIEPCLYDVIHVEAA